MVPFIFFIHQFLHVLLPTMQTTALIPTKFCTTIETIKYSSWVVQPIEGRQPPLWKTVKSQNLDNRIGEIWHRNAHWPVTADRIQDGYRILKIQDGRKPRNPKFGP